MSSFLWRPYGPGPLYRWMNCVYQGFEGNKWAWVDLTNANGPPYPKCNSESKLLSSAAHLSSHLLVGRPAPLKRTQGRKKNWSSPVLWLCSRMAAAQHPWPVLLSLTLLLLLLFRASHTHDGAPVTTTNHDGAENAIITATVRCSGRTYATVLKLS